MINYTRHITTLSNYADEMHDELREACVAAIDLMLAALPKDAEAERKFCTDVLDDITTMLGVHLAYPDDSDVLDAVSEIERARATARAERYVQGREDQSKVVVQLSSAERVHCDAVAARLMGRDGDELLATGTRSMWSSLLERERAAARAEGAAGAARANDLDFTTLRAAARAEGYEAGKSDAGAEWAEGSVALAGVCRDLSERLSAAKAEIEKLKTQRQKWEAEYDYDGGRALLETKLTNLRTAAERYAVATAGGGYHAYQAFCAAIEASK